ncbi:MAG TPA: pyridoxamine 5'-phosphate oxidase family protein [Methanomicrobiales archaeon]|nr:pyridoxamine 5'-phosphate oxidase family protein [Methanomicrobiales archaeon]
MALKDKILQVMGGMHPAAIATLDQGMPAVRFMVLNGFPDLTLVGATGKSSRKVAQLRKNPNASVSIWSGKEFTDPYVVIRAKAEVHEDLPTKKKYWTPLMEQYFKTVDNPEYVVLVFVPLEIELTDPKTMAMETWKR